MNKLFFISMMVFSTVGASQELGRELKQKLQDEVTKYYADLVQIRATVLKNRNSRSCHAPRRYGYLTESDHQATLNYEEKVLAALGKVSSLEVQSAFRNATSKELEGRIITIAGANFSEKGMCSQSFALFDSMPKP